MTSLTRLLAAASVIAVSMAGGAGAQEATETSTSANLARTLVGLLDAHGIHAVAARDSADASLVIAALYVPGTELLVVTGPAPAQLDQHLARGEYQDIYMDVQGAPSSKTRFFVEDLQANGLHSACAAGQPFDIVFDGDSELRFTGDWTTQEMKEADYRARFASADARYARMLTALIARLRPTT